MGKVSKEVAVTKAVEEPRQVSKVVKPDPVKFADLPLISELTKSQMNTAKFLLESAELAAADLARAKEAYNRAIEGLDDLYEDAGHGFRFGELAYSRVAAEGRSSLNREKLIRAGVSVKTLQDCTDLGKPVSKRTFKILSQTGQMDEIE